MRKLTNNQKWVLSFLEECSKNSDFYISPGHIGASFKKGYHSAFASPICKKLVNLGLVERNERGHYRLKK